MYINFLKKIFQNQNNNLFFTSNAFKSESGVGISIVHKNSIVNYILLKIIDYKIIYKIIDIIIDYLTFVQDT